MNKPSNALNPQKNYWRTVLNQWQLHVLILVPVAYLVVFEYWPMYGAQIAFRNYRARQGILGSKWVGWKWFKEFLASYNFQTIFSNTLILSLYQILVSFPIPVLFALIINALPSERFKKFTQTVTYMPHFISVTVLVSMMNLFFSPDSGFVNTILGWLGASGKTYFMGKPEFFAHMYVWSGVWQNMGWSSIIYLAALSGVDPGLHEAATLDGASKLQRVLHIDLPCILPTIVILLVMDCGKIMSVGYEKVYLMQNSLNSEVAEVISTYVYKLGLQQRQYSFSTAIGLFNNVINLILLTTVNKISNKLSGVGLW